MYIIEGNMGAGKSTFLQLVQENINTVTVAFEPLHNWNNNENGGSLLAQFYQNPQRWAYTLETLTLMSRVQEQLRLQAEKAQNVLIERSMYSGYYGFAQNCYEQGFMSSVEWHAYLQWFNFLLAKCATPRGFIYLRLDPAVAYERIKKRNRSAEKTMAFDYLQQVHERHEAFLIRKQTSIPQIAQVPVLILDCNEEFETNHEKLKEHLEALQLFLKTTQPTFKAATVEAWHAREFYIQRADTKDSDVR